MQQTVIEKYATIGKPILDEEYDKLGKGLNLRIIKFKEKFESLEKKFSEELQKEAENLQFKLDQDKQVAKKNFNEIDKVIEENVKVAGSYKTEVENRKNYLDDVDNEMQTLVKSKEQMMTTIDELNVKLNQNQEIITQSEKSVEDTLTVLEKAVANFQEGLSLVFKKIEDDYLLFVFTNIDSNKPSKKFTFQLKILENKKYEVINSLPEVSELPEMVKKLNDTGNLAGFTIAMRKKFLSLV